MNPYNAVVLYHSKTGFSQRYALWLAESLSCRAVPFQERKTVCLPEFATILLIGGLYAGNMSGLSWLKKQLPGLAGRRTAAVAVGCSPMDWPGQAESMERLAAGAPQLKVFYCQGGLAYDRMGGVDRAMMAALRAALRRKQEQAAMLEGISHSFDGSNRAYLDPVIAWAREPA